MAQQLTRAAPALDHIPKEVDEKYQKLVAQQKQEEAEFTERVSIAEARLSQKHTRETQHFWTMHPWPAHGAHHNPDVAPEPIPAVTFSRPQSANYTPNTPIATGTPQQAFRNPVNQLVRMYKQPVVDNLPKPLLVNPPNLHTNSGHNVAKNGNSSSIVRPASRLIAPQSNLNEQASVDAMAKRQDGLTSENTLMHKTKRGSKSLTSRQPVVIDLVSDDDDPQSAMTTAATVKPASDPSIPSASLVFFGGSGRNTKPTQEKPQVKCKDNGKANQIPIYSTQPKAGIRATGTSPSGPHRLPLFSPKPIPRPSYHDKPQPGASTTPISAPSKRSHGSGSARRKKLIPSDPYPEISPSVLREQRNDRSSILAKPSILPRDSALLNLQQQKKDGGFVGSILRNDRSHNWAPGLGKLFQQPSGDVDMQDAPHVNEQQSTSSFHMSASNSNLQPALSEFRAEGFGGSTHYTAAVTASPTDDISDGDPSRMEGLLATRVARNPGDACQSSSNQPFSLSRPDKNIESRSVTGRQLSLKSSPRPVSLNIAKSGEAATSFKVPALPARSPIIDPASDSIPLPGCSDRTQKGTLCPQPSGHTLTNSLEHAFNTLGTRREASVKTQSPVVTPASTVTSTPRKRKKQVSVSSDEESEFEPSPPSSPEGARKALAKPAAGKTECTNCSSFSKKPANKAKRFGFNAIAQRKRARPITPPPSSAGCKSAPSTPRAPKRKKASDQRRLTPDSPSTARGRAPLSSSTPTPSYPALRRLSARSARTAAQTKIDDYMQGTTQFETEERIRTADEMDERINNLPVPAPTPDQLSRGLHGMSLTPAPTTTSSASDDGNGRKKREGSVYNKEKWTRDRLNGDRYLARSKAGTGGDEESGSELDCASVNAQVINGRIYMGPIEELDLTGTAERQDREMVDA